MSISIAPAIESAGSLNIDYTSGTNTTPGCFRLLVLRLFGNALSVTIGRVILCLLLCFGATVHAELPMHAIEQHTDASVYASFEYFEDLDGSYTYETINSLDADQWQSAEGGNATFGFRPSHFWLRLGAVNKSGTTQNLVLEVAYPLLDEVSFYARYADGRKRSLDTGDTLTYRPRDIDNPSMLFRFQLRPEEKVTLHARVHSEGSMILPVRIWKENRFFEFAAKEQKVHFFYYGALTVIILINLAVFFTLRERLYVFYALAIFGYLLFFITSRGFGHQLLFPNFPALNSQAFLSSMPILALFSLLFAREFLRTFQHSPKLDMALRAMIYFEYFNMVAAIVFSYNTAVRISAVSAFVLFAVLCAAGPITWAAKRRSGVFFTIAWVPLTMGFAATAGRTSGFLPNNFLTEYAMQIGSGLEAFILTLALADRLYWEREKKIQAQAESLRIEKQRLAAQSQLTHAMTRDPLTQLPNRNRFEWLINRTFATQADERYIVGVARITRLSEITRTLGLASSEKVLRKIAEQMNAAASRIPGVVCMNDDSGQVEAAFQLTGETFGVLIEQKVSEQNLDKYQSILKTLQRPIEMDSLAIELEPRFGCALYPAHGRDAAQLIRNAHVAMESAHHSPDQIGYYDEALDIYNESRLTLMTDLREALSKDEPALHYQPKLDLNSGKVVGLEALIRWRHPQRGQVSPGEFIPIAEETGVINALTFWAFKRAVRDLVSLRREGYQGNMSINISARDLLSVNLGEQLSSVLAEHGIRAGDIILELTETAAMEDPDAGLTALNQLSQSGLKVSIDDFGAGYSSLSYLKSLPATEIKLDRSLISDICTSDSSRVIVKTSIDMAHSLGYELVAEGVETEACYAMLKDLGCDKLQGFWFCRPLPLDALSEWLKQNAI